MKEVLVAGLLGSVAVWAGDCPAYPQAKRAADRAHILNQRSAANLLNQRGARSRQPARAAANNFIDNYIFDRMAAAGINPAPAATDAEFLRRVSLDVTGRIPSPEQVQSFLADENPNKRAILIDSLVNSKAYVDHWTLYFNNQFQITSGYYNYISIPARNLFHNYLRDFVARDRSYKNVVSELINSVGDTTKVAPANFMMRGIQQGDPVQDTWDTLTNMVTTQFLGVQTQCVSCHDGRRHLEEINLYLVRRRRDEFMRQSSFFSRLNINENRIDAFNQSTRGIITDRTTGAYYGNVNTANPGQRPPRIGGPYEPTYMFNGQRPQSGQWRQELARFVTNDRQFARATVNYLWDHFFRQGIVDPPDAWDFLRIDPRNPPPSPWPIQPSHPELLEALADEFINSGYRVGRMIRLMVESNAYQLSSQYPDAWRPEYERYFAKHFPRRLSPEEIYDAMAKATNTERPMQVEGFSETMQYAGELPDPTEPRNEPAVRTFLATFGRGDWFRLPYTRESSVVQVLFQMNDYLVNFRTFGNTRDNTGHTRVAKLAASPMGDREVVAELYLASLGRMPSDEELATAIRNKRGIREDWLSDVQWALLNHVEFLFNY
ncbi:MAG: DUF1549 domain-containing protein [Bryobacteraceae bacterium]